SPVPVDPPALKADSSGRFERERVRLETELLGPRRVGLQRKVDEARFETVEHQDQSRRAEESRNPTARSAPHFAVRPAGRTGLRCFIFTSLESTGDDRTAPIRTLSLSRRRNANADRHCSDV